MHIHILTRAEKNRMQELKWLYTELTGLCGFEKKLFNTTWTCIFVRCLLTEKQKITMPQVLSKKKQPKNPTECLLLCILNKLKHQPQDVTTSPCRRNLPVKQ